MVSLCACGEEHAGMTQYCCSRGLPEENEATSGSVYVRATVALFHPGMALRLDSDLQYRILQLTPCTCAQTACQASCTRACKAKGCFWHAQINITGYWDLYNRVLSDKTSLQKAGAMPSSGLLGMTQPHSHQHSVIYLASLLKATHVGMFACSCTFLDSLM